MDFSLRKIQGAFLRILNNHPGCGFAAAAPPFSLWLRPHGLALATARVQEGRLPMFAKGAHFDTFQISIAFQPLPNQCSKDFADANLDSCARRERTLTIRLSHCNVLGIRLG